MGLAPSELVKRLRAFNNRASRQARRPVVLGALPHGRASVGEQHGNTSTSALPGEAVADPGFRQNVFRFGGVGLDFLAELVDEDAKVLGLVAIVRPPDGLQ